MPKRDLYEIEGELQSIRLAASELRPSLDWLTSPDYESGDNPDDHCREQDIEFLIAEQVGQEKTESRLLNQIKSRWPARAAEFGA